MVWAWDRAAGCWWPGEKLDPLHMPAGACRQPTRRGAHRSFRATPISCRAVHPACSNLPRPPPSLCRARPARGRAACAECRREAGQPAAVPPAGIQGARGAGAPGCPGIASGALAAGCGVRPWPLRHAWRKLLSGMAHLLALPLVCRAAPAGLPGAGAVHAHQQRALEGELRARLQSSLRPHPGAACRGCAHAGTAHSMGAWSACVRRCGVMRAAAGSPLPCSLGNWAACHGLPTCSDCSGTARLTWSRLMATRVRDKGQSDGLHLQSKPHEAACSLQHLPCISCGCPAQSGSGRPAT